MIGVYVMYGLSVIGLIFMAIMYLGEYAEKRNNEQGHCKL